MTIGDLAPPSAMSETIARHLQEVTGLSHDTALELATVIVGTLVDQLPPSDRPAFIQKVPAAAPRPARAATTAPCTTQAEFAQQVAARTNLPFSQALEASEVVCMSLATLLDAGTRGWLAARLPAALTSWLEQPELSSPPPRPPHGSRRYATLAEGRPGSLHPLSEAHPLQAHRHSIASSGNPHEDTKLSTAKGPTQSREHETLADADPRPARPISTGKQ